MTVYHFDSCIDFSTLFRAPKSVLKSWSYCFTFNRTKTQQEINTSREGLTARSSKGMTQKQRTPASIVRNLTKIQNNARLLGTTLVRCRLLFLLALFHRHQSESHLKLQALYSCSCRTHCIGFGILVVSYLTVRH